MNVDQIVINRLQLRLAIELAGQRAAQAEIKKQVQQQMPGCAVTVDGAEIDIVDMKWPEFSVCGQRVMWE